MTHFNTLRLILGDQLNPAHSWYKDKKTNTLYVIAELKQETSYVKHHIQKICAFFCAMENFATALNQAGFNVLHLTLNETCNDEDLPALLTRIAAQHQCNTIEYQYPDEYRLKTQLAHFANTSPLTVSGVDSEHFLLPFGEIKHRFIKALIESDNLVDRIWPDQPTPPMQPAIAHPEEYAGESAQSWAFGLRRLLLGYTVGAGEAWQGIEPFDDIGGLLYYPYCSPFL